MEFLISIVVGLMLFLVIQSMIFEEVNAKTTKRLLDWNFVPSLSYRFLTGTINQTQLSIHPHQNISIYGTLAQYSVVITKAKQLYSFPKLSDNGIVSQTSAFAPQSWCSTLLPPLEDNLYENIESVTEMVVISVTGLGEISKHH